MVYKHYKTYESRCSWIYLIKTSMFLLSSVKFAFVLMLVNGVKWMLYHLHIL